MSQYFPYDYKFTSQDPSSSTFFSPSPGDANTSSTSAGEDFAEPPPSYDSEFLVEKAQTRPKATLDQHPVVARNDSSATLPALALSSLAQPEDVLPWPRAAATVPAQSMTNLRLAPLRLSPTLNTDEPLRSSSAPDLGQYTHSRSQSGSGYAPSPEPLPASAPHPDKVSPLFGGRSVRSLLNPPPPPFCRAPPPSDAETPFAPLVVPALGERFLADGFPAVLPAMEDGEEAHPFATHDVREADWMHFLTDIKRAAGVAGFVFPLVSVAIIPALLLGIRISKRRRARNRVQVRELVRHWNESFFNPRYMHVELVELDELGNVVEHRSDKEKGKEGEKSKTLESDEASSATEHRAHVATSFPPGTYGKGWYMYISHKPPAAARSRLPQPSSSTNLNDL